MTCPIRKPFEQDLELLPIYWLNQDQPWNPSIHDECLSMNTLVPRGYTEKSNDILLTKTVAKDSNPDDLSRFFLFRPQDIITSTLAATTRLAMTIDNINMRRHFKSRFPALNRPRLQATYATDTWFA